jgi:hypothetical protein
MAPYLPGAILAALGVIVYVTACLLYLAYRRQLPKALSGKSPPPANDNTGPNSSSKALLYYAIALMILGMLSLCAGLFALEATQMQLLRG